MKKFTLIALAASLAACGGNNGTANLGSTASTLPESSIVAAASTESMDSSQFLIDTWRDSQGEISLSQLALQRASDDRVKKFAQTMIDQHTVLNQQLAAIAQAKNITLPSEPTADQASNTARLTAASAADFDRLYMQVNVAVHEKDLAAFKQQAKQGSDADIRKLADAVVPLLELHLIAAEDINDILDPNAFLATAYQDGLAEIQLAQLALQKATNADVKAFAQRMIDDHTQANSKIATLAQQSGLSLPTAPGTEQQSIANALATFSGADFDEAYMDENAAAHVKDVLLFRHQSNAGMNEAVKSFAESTLPVLVNHLDTTRSVDAQIQPSFPFKAWQDSKAEIRISALALLKSSNNEVRTFAQGMIADHGRANDQLAALAAQKNIPLPDALSPGQTLALAAMYALSGENFDRAYAEYSVRAHEKDVTAFTEQAQQGSDADFRQFAQTNLPVLNAHLAQANALKKSVGTLTVPNPLSPDQLLLDQVPQELRPQI
jgi:predicted outer membrane protein